MKKNFKKILSKKYDQFICTENISKKNKLGDEIILMLKMEKKLDSNSYYIWGLIDYDSEDWKKNINKSITNFQKAIELNKSHYLAQLYLAHCYHDINNLNKALENYLKVDRLKLKEFQIWRYTKLIEQIGYCNYKLGNKKIGEEHFEIVLNLYRELPEIDRVVPSELLDCLPENHRIVIEIKKIETYLN